MRTGGTKVFRDPIHNLIEFQDEPEDRLLLGLINTREMQRLRRIKQMGVSEQVFPGADHSRFAHSLGVLHVARQFLAQLSRWGPPPPPELRACVLCAALLHDVGHGPFSHVFELVTGKPHEGMTRQIIQDPATEVNACLKKHSADLPGRLAQFFDDAEDAGHLARIVSGQLDADRCDYLLRDSHATGTNYGNFDLAWMLAQLRPDPDNRRFYLTRKGLAAAETYLFARYHMYRTVYFHKTSRAAEVMLKLLFRRYREIIGEDPSRLDVPVAIRAAIGGESSLTSYLEADDHTVTELMKACSHSSDSVLSSLALGLLHRRLYKCVDVTGQVASQQLDRIIEFREKVRGWLTTQRLSPEYYFVEDTASDTPYEPYAPDEERPARQIFVEGEDGKIVEISQLSEALMQLRRTYTVMRYYFPAEVRPEVSRIAADVLWRR
jgi:HD superfamily phosphohydrolase